MMLRAVFLFLTGSENILMQVTGQLPAMDAAQPDHFLTIQLLSASIAAMLIFSRTDNIAAILALPDNTVVKCEYCGNVISTRKDEH